MHYFFGYIDQDTNHLIIENDEAHHCAIVLRLKKGDIIGVLIANAHHTQDNHIVFIAELLDVHKKRCIAIIKEKRFFQKPSITVHLVVSPPKNNERLEWLVEKSVELQATSILFIKSERCIRKNINIDRLKNIALAAAKQSINPILPEIMEFPNFQTLLLHISISPALYLLPHCDISDKKLNFDIEFIQQIQQKNCKNIYVFIGPEGDWSKNEIDTMLSQLNPIFEIQLGGTRLRTETAAIYILSVLRGIS
ncbi:MAG: 16S rRNA (uracil(1498)-N(3))-methyltransferase [Bacteroidia bacterium]|nr:16S rRNA (uracil(1498)-N(3))-methyltransferase [Bacteroidia bacterium]